MLTKHSFTFADGRLEVLQTSSSKKSIVVNIKVGEFTGIGYISVDNFIYMLENPSVQYKVEQLAAQHYMKNDVYRYFPSTLWVAPYKPSRF